MAALLVGERAAADAAVAADDALVAELLSLDPAARERAVAALATRSPDRAGWQASEPAGRQAGGQAAEPAGRSAPERLRGPSRSLQVVALRGVTADRAQAEVALRHAVLDARRTGLATVAGPTAAAVRFSGDTMALAERMIAAANEVAGGRFTCVAGVGPRVATLEEAWTSHRHAELATRAIPHLAPGPVVDAATLGAFGLLLRIPELDPTALPAPVATLLAADSRGVLVRTLEAYLRHAGSAPAAADELHIHRTTLHYRLDRVRSIAGCDPDDGETRLLLHLGLGVARLLGLLAGEQMGPVLPRSVRSGLAQVTVTLRPCGSRDGLRSSSAAGAGDRRTARWSASASPPPRRSPDTAPPSWSSTGTPTPPNARSMRCAGPVGGPGRWSPT